MGENGNSIPQQNGLASHTSFQPSNSGASPARDLSVGSTTAPRAQVPESEVVPIGVKVALGFGESCQAIYTFIAGFHLNLFLLETACLPPSYVGILQLAAGLWDTVNDPFIGSLSDRTRTRWGRRRPWLLFASPPLGLAFFGLFHSFDSDSNEVKLFYYLVMILSACITSIQVQVGALTPELTRDYDERTTVATYRLCIANVMGLICVFAMTQLTESFSTAERYKGYSIGGMIFGGTMTTCGLYCFLRVYERYNPDAESDKPLPCLKGLRIVFSNKAFVYIVLVYLFGLTATVTVQTNLVLYLKYILNAEDQFSYFIAIVQGGVMLTLPFWSWFSKRHGKKEMYFCGGTVLLLMLPLLFLMKFMSDQIWFAYLIAMAIGFSLAVVYLAPYSMLPDVIEVDELATGKRREGVYFGFFTVFMKLSTTAMLALSTFALGIAGYEAPQTSCGGAVDGEDELAPTQPPEVEWLLCALVGPFPALCMAFALFFVWLYPITREKQQQMMEQAKHLQAQNRLAHSRAEASNERDGECSSHGNRKKGKQSKASRYGGASVPPSPRSRPPLPTTRASDSN